MNGIEFTHGTNEKPVALEDLQEVPSSLERQNGDCFFDYPLIATPEGKFFLDVTLVTREKDIILLGTSNSETSPCLGIQDRSFVI